MSYKIRYRIIYLPEVPKEYKNEKGKPNIALISRDVKAGKRIPGIETYYDRAKNED
jgi:hypothetical protein